MVEGEEGVTVGVEDEEEVEGTGQPVEAGGEGGEEEEEGEVGSKAI